MSLDVNFLYYTIYQLFILLSYHMKISTPVYTMSDRCLSFIREIAIFLLREKSPID